MSPKAGRNIKSLVSHISRIQGQLESLKTNLQEEKTRDSALLATSAIKSFDSLRAKIIETYVLNELIPDRALPLEKIENFQTILKLVRA